MCICERFTYEWENNGRMCGDFEEYLYFDNGGRRGNKLYCRVWKKIRENIRKWGCRSGWMWNSRIICTKT